MLEVGAQGWDSCREVEQGLPGRSPSPGAPQANALPQILPSLRLAPRAALFLTGVGVSVAHFRGSQVP